VDIFSHKFFVNASSLHVVSKTCKRVADVLYITNTNTTSSHQLPGADPGIKQRRAGWRAREREPPAGSRGRAPGQGLRGRIPLKLKNF